MNPKDRIGSTKPPMSGFPTPAMLEAGAVFLLGARKYGRHNWRRDAVFASAYYDGIHRHLARWWEGEDIDPESGLSHLAHIIAGAAILHDGHLRGMMNDDRPPPTPEVVERLEERVRQILADFPNPPAPITRETEIPDKRGA